MKIHTLILGQLQTNCYIIESQNKNAIIIDCGDNSDRVISFLKENDLQLKKILLTHGHFDHIGAVSEVMQATGAEVYIHTNDAGMLIDSRLSLASELGLSQNNISLFTEICDGDKIILDEINLKVIHTSGHTKGSVCFIGDGVTFSGDTLFEGTVGRTDFPGGSFPEIKKSIDRLAALDGDYRVYTGHGASTTLSKERDTNIYFRDNYNDFDF